MIEQFRTQAQDRTIAALRRGSNRVSMPRKTREEALNLLFKGRPKSDPMQEVVIDSLFGFTETFREDVSELLGGIA
ncbi:MAG: hypothetical protein AB7F50_01895 [Fimbriimonadaceae bacterium]